ncbi:MAG: 23S rRNA (uracil(1939)-C(5))-methyltransferase RlmD, partial [Lachnospiraceae bacterium]
DKEQVIYGKGYIEDILCQKVFKLSPKSFYQVNPVQTRVLYEPAVSFARLTGKETILDAYCGIGTIGMLAAAQARQVIGVELNREAVRDAVFNAKKNGIKNIDFYQKDAGQFMLQLAQQQKKLDVVFMDPPRSGSDEAFLTALITCAPKRIVYISCNPQTLSRDLKVLARKGYQVKKIQGVDMFPHTEHVECVVLMARVQK